MESNILQSEAAFADKEYSFYRDDLAINQTMFRKYADPKHLHDWREQSAKLLQPIQGKELLDYGCGMGEETTHFAKLGAHVTAIDVSPVGVEITRRRAAFNGVEDGVTALVADATKTPFAENSFDLVHGLGILHHVGLQDGLAEVRRVLKPGGSGVFLEPLGNVQLVERCKAWLHKRLRSSNSLIDVTEDEKNLTIADIREAVRGFSQTKLYYYRLFYRIRKLAFPRMMHPALEWADYHLLRFLPFLRPFAGAIVIHVVK